MSDIEDTLAPETSTLPQSASKAVILRVGETYFHTTTDTLSGSGMLSAMLERWDTNKQPDGSFPIDADPEIFRYVLRFLRSGVYPLCYDNVKGHDFFLYAAIHQLANFLIVDDLSNWLSKQLYHQVVTIETSTKVVEGEDELVGAHGSDSRAQYHPSWTLKKKYVCPRGISKHYDNPRGCGRACRSAQGDKEDEYVEVSVLETLVVMEKVVFNNHRLYLGE
ncbi:MAG: hypothetical protein Q9170_008129 [Blastenia crenularia]